MAEENRKDQQSEGNERDRNLQREGQQGQQQQPGQQQHQQGQQQHNQEREGNQQDVKREPGRGGNETRDDQQNKDRKTA
jgi:Ca-activated chloride channel family protein